MKPDAYIGRVIMRGRREVLELGRRVRLFTAAQERAVIARDGPTCGVDGCTNPGDHMHDLNWWDNGGRTDLANALRICGAHHARVHQGLGRLERLPDGSTVYTPLQPDARG